MKKYKTGSEFKSALGNEEVTVLFYASWCPDCTRFNPQFEKKFAKKEGCAMVAIDSDDDPAWDLYDIKEVPSVLVFKSKKISKRHDFNHGALRIEDVE